MNDMMIQQVFATDDNGGIGNNNRLPWPFNRKDMQEFIRLTTGTILVMGKNTWFSLPNKLRGRVHVVLSSQSLGKLSNNGEYPDIVIDYRESIDDIRLKLQNICDIYQIYTVSIIGGKQTYEMMLPITDVIYHTHINGTYESDVYLDIKSLTNSFNAVLLNSTLDKDKVYLNKYERKTQL